MVKNTGTEDIQIKGVLSDGLGKIETPAGMKILGMIVAEQVAWTFISSTVSSGPMTVMLSLINIVITAIITVGAIRHFAKSDEELRYLDISEFKSGIKSRVISYIFALVVLMVLTLAFFAFLYLGVFLFISGSTIPSSVIGVRSIVLLLIPLLLVGLFVLFLAHLFLFPTAIVLEDMNSIESVDQSWSIVSQQRKQFFVVFLALVGISVMLSVFSAGISTGLVSDLLQSAVSGAVATYTSSVSTQAYIKVTGSDGRSEEDSEFDTM